jgi:hypothetical protein
MATVAKITNRISTWQGLRMVSKAQYWIGQLASIPIRYLPGRHDPDICEFDVDWTAGGPATKQSAYHAKVVYQEIRT